MISGTEICKLAQRLLRLLAKTLAVYAVLYVSPIFVYVALSFEA